MAREEKPLEYQGRIRDTKNLAQRLDLDYLKRPRLLAVLRSRLTWVLVAAAVAASVPLVMGVGTSRKTLTSGPVSQAHAHFGSRCEACHAQSFQTVADAACQKCHDGAPHPAKPIDTAKPRETVHCAQCHMEHQGKAALAEAGNGNCTSCHADLAAHASGPVLKAASITGFQPQKHPEFSAGATPDARPLKLNHAIHMPAQAKTVRNVNLPMKCADCHATDHDSPTGAFLPVTFEKNCKTCHARELEFDVYHVLSPATQPAPHTKDPRTIHQYILSAYRDALAANPALARMPLGEELRPAANWLDRVVKDSEQYLFGKKCGYCHTMAAFATVQPVGRIAGRFAAAKPEGEPWLPRGEFEHRAHRAVECATCHVNARTSTKTADVLIPAMKSCTPCHGQSGTGLDRCSACHQYHNRSLQKQAREVAP